jgi:hypothetical protein
LATDTPNESKIISEAEKDYVIDATKETVAAHAKGESVW